MAGSRLFSLVFPNFQIYSVTDSALNGRLIPLSLFGTLALITLGYFVFHMTLAAWLFRKKEFLKAQPYEGYHQCALQLGRNR